MRMNTSAQIRNQRERDGKSVHLSALTTARKPSSPWSVGADYEDMVSIASNCWTTMPSSRQAPAARRGRRCDYPRSFAHVSFPRSQKGRRTAKV